MTTREQQFPPDWKKKQRKHHLGPLPHIEDWTQVPIASVRTFAKAGVALAQRELERRGG